ncbi:MAG TPA: hypothetical protein VGL45_01965 [Bradyrhizobium sp.]
MIHTFSPGTVTGDGNIPVSPAAIANCEKEPQANVSVAARNLDERTLSRRIEALLDVRRPIPRHYLCCIDPVRTFKQFELFGAPLRRGLAVLGRDLVGIDQLLREAGRKRNCRDDRDQQAAPDHLHPQEISRNNWHRTAVYYPSAGTPLVKQLTIAQQKARERRSRTAD